MATYNETHEIERPHDFCEMNFETMMKIKLEAMGEFGVASTKRWSSTMPSHWTYDLFTNDSWQELAVGEQWFQRGNEYVRLLINDVMTEATAFVYERCLPVDANAVHEAVERSKSMAENAGLKPNHVLAIAVRLLDKLVIVNWTNWQGEITINDMMEVTLPRMSAVVKVRALKGEIDDIRRHT